MIWDRRPNVLVPVGTEQGQEWNWEEDVKRFHGENDELSEWMRMLELECEIVYFHTK